MSDYLDFEGKSVEQAVEKACQELNVTKEALIYDIISYGSTGIFGLVRTKKALIRVTPPETGAVEASDLPSEDASPPTPQAEAEANESRSAIDDLINEAFGEAPEGEPAPGEAASKSEPEPESETESESEPAAMATDEAIAVAEDLLKQILSLLSPEAQVANHRDNDQHRIHISGGEPAILIGRKGQTLEAMQYLVDKTVNKQCGKGYRIVVDVEGYLETRRNELTEAANRLADKARRTGKPSTMNRMNAHDRRIVHLALKNNKAVRTQSVGDGYYRKLMIVPKRRKGHAKAGARTRQNQ